ncbi:Tubulin polyglutamylase TTLL5 [Portunus trituberculatus]|uniref:Tubulin--tyrosine ligase-like protein 5 n=1 Tax=Portunus trituberculatus TaxID=210409 RepID=A0A5B7CSQ6_PORTR|nr:Tubulin polyglutamylase TTLL5 [Portunus trituberculatus]
MELFHKRGKAGRALPCHPPPPSMTHQGTTWRGASCPVRLSTCLDTPGDPTQPWSLTHAQDNDIQEGTSHLVSLSPSPSATAHSIPSTSTPSAATLPLPPDPAPRNEDIAWDKSDSSRSLSLDRRRAEGSRRESASPSTSSTERKRRECENRDIQNIQNREKKPKTRLPGGHSRSQSGEQGRLLGRQKMAQPTLSHGKGDSSKTYIVEEKSTTKIEEKKFPFHMDWAERVKRATSRSPSRTQTTTSEPSEREDKENEKVREKGKGDLRNQDKKERGRSLKRENRTNKHASNGKHKFEEHFTMDGDVMWVGSSRRNGYLIFNCGTLEEPPKNSTAQRYTMTFKFSQSDSKLIRMLMEAHGFSEVESSSSFFNLYWGNAHFNPNEIRQLQDWQKVNHFPRSSELTRKDRLYMNIKRMQRQFGVKLFDFIPTSFILPTEYRDFCDTHLRERGTWIVKPVASSQGKGIYLINQVDQVPADETSLLCRYIESPLLVDGYKCDLRLYVGVTSLDPLVVYLYEEGLVRLATVKYQHGKNLWNPCIHLTNYSVNKFHSNYVQNEDPEVDDQGNKWSLSAFLRHLKSQGIDTGSLMRSIEDVIIKSLLAASYQMNTATNMFVPHPRNCFELYGFDILIDSQLKPWVLEVNLSPSLNIDQPLDLKIKSAMLADLFSLVGVQVVNPYTAKTSSRPSVFRKLPYLRYSMDAYEKHQFAKGTNIIPTTEEIRIVRQSYITTSTHMCHEQTGPNKKEDNNECRDLKKVKANVIRALENGLALSKYQARMAFSVYLQHIQRRLMIGCDEEKQTDLVYRFLRSASRTLHSPMNVQNPSKTLPSEARAVVISKQLGDFIQAYTRETHIYLDPAASASCSSLSSQCPTTTTTSSEPSTPYVTSPPYTSTLSINSPPAGSSVSLLSGSMSASTSFINHASAAVCGSSASINNSGASHLNTTSSSVIAPHHPVETPELCTPVKQSYSLASVSNLSSVSFSRCSSASVRNGSLLNKSASALSSLSSASTANNISHVSLSSISSVSVSNPSPLNQSLSVSSFSSPLSLSNSSSFTSTNNSSSIPFSASSNSISSPPSVSVTGSSTSINLPPPSKTPSSVSIASFNSASDIGGEIATLPPRIRRLKSDGDNSLSVADDGSKMSTSLDSAELEKHTTEQQPQQQQQQQQMSKDDHITMDLYRAFMSNAGESDLEEVLALQTRMHNSAGVFLESHRRSRIYPGSSHSVAGTATSHPSTTASSTCSSRPRTPTASPHGSPRRARRSPSTGSHTKVGEPVTNEPHSQNTEGPSSSQSQTSSDLPPSSSSSSSSTATTTAAMATTQASHPRSQPPATTTASSCCLFGNILKASLKGTNTFIS